MPTMRKTLQQPLGPDDIPARCRNDLMRDDVVPGRGEWSNDPTVALILDALVQSLPGMACLTETNRPNGTMSVAAGSGLDDHLWKSEKMRGLIFRECSRRILNLMLAREAAGQTDPSPVTGSRLN